MDLNNKSKKIKKTLSSFLSKFKSADEESDFAEKIFNTVREPLLLLDKDLRVIKASKSFYDFFKETSNKTIGKLIYNIGNQQWDIPELRELLETILPEKTTFDNYEVVHDFSKIGKRVMHLNARTIPRGMLEKQMILLAMEDITERKHDEELLSEKNRLNKEYLDILLNHAHVPIIIWNSSLQITRFNHEFEKLCGYSETEIRGKELKNIIPENKLNSELNLVNNILVNEKLNVIELNILTKSKEIKTVQWYSVSVFDKDGTKIVATIAQDITKRKEEEDKIKNLESRYRRLFESTKDGILILDAETGKIIDVNPFLIDLMGYSKEEFIDKELWQIGFLKDIATNKEKFLELQKKEYVRYENLPLETTDGRKINVEFVSNVYLVNNLKVIQCNIRDITERKKAVDLLQESEEKFRIITENSADAIFIVDDQGRYLYVNTRAVQMLGYSKEEMMRFTIADISPKDRAEEYFLIFKRLLNVGFAIAEIDLVAKDGNLISADFNAVLLPNGFIYASCRDISERIEIQNKIKFQAELLSNVGQAVIATDLSGRVIYWNHAAENIYGWTIEDAMGKNIIDLTPAEQTKEQASEIMKQLIAGNSWSGEFLVKRKDGSSFTSFVTDTPIHDSNGKLIGVIGISSDITERKRSEELLLKLSQAVEQSPVSIIITDTNGTIEYVNQKLIESTGYQQSEIVGRNPRMFASGEIPKIEYKKLWDTILSKKEWSGELHNKKKNGELYWELALISPIINKNGDVTHFVATKEDITEKKRAEDKIMLLAHALKSINECVSITDIEDKIVFANESFLKTSGYDENELLGKNMNLVRSAKNSPDLTEEILHSTLQGGWNGELWNKRKDGSEFQIYYSRTSIYDKENKLQGFLGVAKDITESKLIQQELVKAKDKAEESDKLKSEFLAQMSHEIRTPLNAIVGNSDFLHELLGENINSDTRDCFEGIELASKRIIRTVDLILNFSELEQNSYKAHFKIINIHSEILYKLYQENQLSAKQKGLELTYHCTTAETMIKGDEYSVTQIFSHLIDNAIKYTRKGKVEIILSKGDNGKIIVEVKDTGIGISKEFLPIMFKPFLQEEQGYTRSYDGNGLGLALVKKYCEINFATIEVESVKNEGSIFRVIFDIVI